VDCEPVHYIVCFYTGVDIWKGKLQMIVYVPVTCNDCWLVVEQRNNIEKNSSIFIVSFVVII